MSDLRAAFYGDDFTGSVDALLQFAREGWRGRLFVGLPPQDRLIDAATTCDVIGIAGIARSLPTPHLDAEVRPVLEALLALRPSIVQYKACSTADSAPHVGSIGRVLEIARELVGPAPIPVLFAQPDFGRYTVFGQHFAREGDTVYRLDRQPTMSTHPTTPMTEADLAVHLSRQTALPIVSLPFTAYTDAASVHEILSQSRAAAIVLDATGDGDLALVGEAVTQLPPPVFAVGSGGLSTAIATATAGSGGELPRSTPARGPVLAVSGSRSAQTRRQMDAAAAAGWLVCPMPVNADDLQHAVAEMRAALQAGRSVAFRSDEVRLIDGADPLPALASAASDLVMVAAREDLAHRFIVCGGDTSSRVTTLLGVSSLSIAANPTGNIVLLSAHSPDASVDGIELMLKGGQVGDDELFMRIQALDDGDD